MENNSRDFKGVWIPKEIWLNKDLSLQEKCFLVEINSLDNEDGCFANNEYFANFFNLSKDRISKIISYLVEKKYITNQMIITETNQRKRILKINMGVSLETTKGIVENAEGGIVENAEYNNIYNNIYIYTEKLISSWNDIKTQDNLWHICRSSDNIKSQLPKMLKKYKFKDLEKLLDSIFDSLQNYFDHCKSNTWYTHRFSLYEFLKQENGYFKYLNK